VCNQLIENKIIVVLQKISAFILACEFVAIRPVSEPPDRAAFDQRTKPLRGSLRRPVARSRD
jgi:hypothetical protein